MSAPFFSVVTPVYDTPPALLREAIASVEAQTWTDWELILVDDCSPSPHVGEILDEAAVRDERIRVLRRRENGGIVAASNDGLTAATGEFIALLDHDDLYEPDALEKVAATIEAHGRDHVDYVYTDEDKVDEAGARSQPFHKPDWSPDRFRCQMYTCHLSVLRRSLVDEVGGFRPGFDGAQDFDLVFRVTERARTIVHVPEVLYHWRIIAASTAADVNAKPYAWESGRRAIQEHCDRTGFEAVAELREAGLYGLRPVLRDQPKVSIIIPTAAGFREVHGERVMLAELCIRSIVERSTYENYEILLVVDDHVPLDRQQRMVDAGAGRVHRIVYDKPFNFADKCNVGAVLADGEHLLFLNDDTEVIEPGWMESMLVYSRSAGVGGVGARLLFGDRRVQHVGVAFLEPSRPGHIYRGYGEDFHGYFDAARIPCNYSAVTAACLMSPKAVFNLVGGFSVDLPVNFNDVDYCYKLREAGYRIVFDPRAELYHHESSTRPVIVDLPEIEALEARWGHLERDPYLNPNLVSINLIPA